MEGLPKTRPQGVVLLIYTVTLYIISNWLFIPLLENFFTKDTATRITFLHGAGVIVACYVLFTAANIVARVPRWYMHETTIAGYAVFVCGVVIASFENTMLFAGIVLCIAWLLLIIGLVETCTNAVFKHQGIEHMNAGLTFVAENRKAIERSKNAAATQHKE